MNEIKHSAGLLGVEFYPTVLKLPVPKFMFMII